MNFPTYFHQPSVIGVVEQYPLYRQIFEDTKNRELNRVQIERLGLKQVPNSQIRMFELEIDRKQLF